ncbi:hypothetical protein GQ53DRAFT_713747 [Thozetella sp. PMI_491]|nr:hypothetical protein GQ53DRAFT_713747 [Thozetella sp. PMI_491]
MIHGEPAQPLTSGLGQPQDASQNGGTPPDVPGARKRARRACLPCRVRKIRCDVLVCGKPCTNCRLESESCVVMMHRGRKWLEAPLPKAPQETYEQPPSPGESAAAMEEDPTHDLSLRQDASLPPPNDELLLEIEPAAEPNVTLNPRGPPLIDALAPIGAKVSSECVQYDPGTPPIGTFPTEVVWARTPAFVFFSCHPQIDPSPLWNLPSTSMAILEQQGCLHVPEKSVLREFIGKYFQYVHPILPVLMEHELQTVCTIGSMTPLTMNSHVSLYILQAMLFISCPTLFSVLPQIDDIASAQGALMLTYHAPTTKSTINSYWLSIAILHARKAGASQYSTLVDDTVERKSMKRLWWCCILRDRIMSLGLRRQLQIDPAEFDFTLPGLTEDDFIDGTLTPEMFGLTQKHKLLQPIICLCKFGVLLNNFLPILYPKDPALTEGDFDNMSILEDSLHDLDIWYEETSGALQAAIPLSGSYELLVLFASMINIYYHTAKVTICIHIMLKSTLALEADGKRDGRLLDAQDKLGSSLGHIRRDLGNLKQRGLTKYLPNTFVAFTAFPFIWHLLDTKLVEDGSHSCQKNLGTDIYSDVMEGFRHLYETTENVLRCVDQIVEYIRMNELQYFPYPGRGDQWIMPWNKGVSLPSKQLAAQVPRNGWVEMLVEKPQSFLRIVMIVEFSLSRGQLPAEDDFPKSLQLVRWDTSYPQDSNPLDDYSDAGFFEYLSRALYMDIGAGA